MRWLRRLFGRDYEIEPAGANRTQQDMILSDAHERIARYLADLAIQTDAVTARLTPEQSARRWDLDLLDRLLQSGERGERVEDYLLPDLEIRKIGYQLYHAGGEPLMVAVCERVGILEHAVAAGRYVEKSWEGIGPWKG